VFTVYTAAEHRKQTLKNDYKKHYLPPVQVQGLLQCTIGIGENKKKLAFILF